MNLLLPSEFAPPTDAVPLAQQQPPEGPGGQGEDFGKSSPVGLVVMLLFFVAVVLLVRSMNKHLRRVPKSFDPPQQRTDTDDDSDNT